MFAAARMLPISTWKARIIAAKPAVEKSCISGGICFCPPTL
jgi:hypothetical protein